MKLPSFGQAQVIGSGSQRNWDLGKKLNMQLTEVKRSRKDFFKSKINVILQGVMTRKSRLFLKARFPQMVVFAFDHVGNTINIEGRYEREELDLIIKFLRSNRLITGSAVDVGANIGNHSLFFSEYFDHVFAYEPHPLTFQILNINRQYKQNVSVKNIAIGDSSGFLPFYTPNGSNISSARLVKTLSGENLPNENVISVEVERLDNLDELKDSKIGLIKIDVEGHELNVLRGAQALINLHSPVILIEQHVKDFDRGRSDVIDLLRSVGYRFYVGKHSPERGNHLSNGSRLFNLMTTLIVGSRFYIEECEVFQKKFYSLIIAIRREGVCGND